MGWWVYIVRCSDGTFYTGVSNNLKARIKKHNSGEGAKYTQSRRPVELVYKEKSLDRSRSLKREIEIKKLKRSEKLELINTLNFTST
tara:strand:- start:1248 stop:1508 length:261 start_codon:yes stop_codon:yes gene_type:complete